MSVQEKIAYGYQHLQAVTLTPEEAEAVHRLIETARGVSITRYSPSAERSKAELLLDGALLQVKA